MSDQQTQLLEKLAAQLGTTAEKLWGILLHQAPIDAAWNVLQYAIFIVSGVILYRAHKRFVKNNQYEYGPTEVIMICLALIWGMVLIVAFFCLPYAFTGFYNPEYWALQHIMASAQ